jgi:tetratricopeptide (TPR) repeat protein
MSVSPLFKKIVLGAVDQGIDVAGSALLPGAWPIVKGALDPILDRLKSQLGGDEDITASHSRAQAAIEVFEKNAHLQEVFRSTLLEEIGVLVEGQKDINDDIQKLALIVEGNDQLLKEVGEGVADITQILEEGVELNDASVEKLVAAITKRLQTTRSVRAMAWQEMDLVEELISRQVSRLQRRAVELVQEGALDRALDELQEGSALVSALINEAPTDVHLRLQLGFIYKAFAQVYDRAIELLGDESFATQRDDFTQRAEKVFSYVKDDVSSDHKRALDVANAIHGLGNVRQQRKDFKGALENYRLAAYLEPAHIFAWHDIVVTYYQMARGGELDPDAMNEALTKVKELEAAHPTLGAQQISRLEQALVYVKGRAAVDCDS